MVEVDCHDRAGMKDVPISASTQSGSDLPWDGYRRRVVATLCAVLVLASGLWSVGLQASTFAVPYLSVAGHAGDRLSAEDPAELAAILAWRQVAGVEAKRIVPEGPTPQPATLPPSFASFPTCAGTGLRTWHIPRAEARLLLLSRTPTGPPIA